MASADGVFADPVLLSPRLSQGQGGFATGDWPRWLGDFAGIASAGDRVHVAFSDNRNGDADVYYAAVP